MVIKLKYLNNEVVYRQFTLSDLFSVGFLKSHNIINYFINKEKLYIDPDNVVLVDISEKFVDNRYYVMDLRDYFYNFCSPNFKFSDEVCWEFLEEGSYEYILNYISSNLRNNLYYVYVFIDWEDEFLN